jgi:hypothetical protein
MALSNIDKILAIAVCSYSKVSCLALIRRRISDRGTRRRRPSLTSRHVHQRGQQHDGKKTTMNENRDNQGLQQQPNDAARQQTEQQNQQGETRQPQQQDQNPQQAQQGQQNQQADRDRRANEGIEGTDQEDLNDGGVTGGNGDIRPGRTGDGGAER